MKKNLIVAIAFVLIIAHIIPPYNTIFANDEENTCEMSDFTVQTIKENDEKIKGAAQPSQQLKIEFKTKNKTESVNVNSSGQFELAVEEKFLEVNDVVTVSNEHFKAETKVASGGAASQSIQSSQYAECPVIEVEPEEPVVEEVTAPEETLEDGVDEEDVAESEEVPEKPVVEEVTESEEVPEESVVEEEVTESEEISESTREQNEPESISKETVPFKSNVRYTREILENTETNSLTDVSLLTNIAITNSIDIEQPPIGIPYNVELKLTGSGVADVELLNTNRVVAFSIPELAGQMTATGPADVSVDLTLVTLDDLPILGNVVGGLTGTLTTTVNGVLSLVSNLESSLIPDALITIDGVEELQGSLDALNNIEQALADALQYNGTAPVTVNSDGTVTVDMTDGLGNNLDTAVNSTVIGTLEDLVNSLNGVSISILPEAENIPLLGSVVRALNATINTTLSGLTGLVGTVTETLANLDVPGLTSELARAQLLGSTNVDLNLAVDNPVQFEPGADNIVPVYGSVVNTAVIDANLIGNGTGQSEIIFPEQRDETAPVINTVEIAGNLNAGYTVSGTGEEPGDTIRVTNSSGIEVGTGTFETDNTFSIIIAGEVAPDEILQVQASDKAGNKSEIHEVTVPILKLVRVPSNIDFGAIEIKNEESIFGRKSSDNVIEIKDTRKNDDWVLRAKAPNLSDGTNSLIDGLVYLRNGEEIVINETEAIVAESSDSNVVQGTNSETITWNNNIGSEDGLLLKVNPIEALANVEYSSTIEWTLTDGP